MKVILLKDVKKMGRAHEEVEISDGHALNYLIPQKFAVAATAAARKQAEMRKKAAGVEKEVSAALIRERIEALAEGQVKIAKKANEKGHLYDAVDAAEIADAAQLPESAIKLEKPIKELGTIEIPVALGEQFGKFSITIEAE